VFAAAMQAVLGEKTQALAAVLDGVSLLAPSVK
jgi:hypothetical protein